MTIQEVEPGTEKKQQGRAWHTFFAGVGALWERFVCFLSNMRRRMMRGHKTDYAVIRLDHALAERTPAMPWYYGYLPGFRPPLSLESLQKALERIAHDP